MKRRMLAATILAAGMMLTGTIPAEALVTRTSYAQAECWPNDAALTGQWWCRNNFSATFGSTAPTIAGWRVWQNEHRVIRTVVQVCRLPVPSNNGCPVQVHRWDMGRDQDAGRTLPDPAENSYLKVSTWFDLTGSGRHIQGIGKVIRWQ